MAGHFPYRFRPCQEEMVSFIRNSVLLGRCAVIESGTGTGKTATSLAGCLDAVDGTGRKVVFLTRTKSQHRQVAVECRAISENRRVISVSVQGRSPATCPMIAESAELSDGTPEELSRLCSEVKKGNSSAGRCRFFESITDQTVERCLSYIQSNGPDPEDFREFCTGLGVCPYEMTKRIIPYADVISASYIFMFDPQIRSRFMSWLGVTEKETVLIVDEAHNLPDFLREGRTRKITDRALDLCLKEAKDYGNPDVGGGMRAVDVIMAVKGILAEAVGEYLEDKEDALLPSTFMVEGLMVRLAASSYGLRGMIAGLLDAGARVADEKSSRRKLPRSHMTVLGRFLQAWMDTDGTYIHLVVGGENPCLEAYCMDIQDTALPLRTCRASVSMSGTLEPIKYYCRDLGLEDADSRVFPSPFDPRNRRTIYVSDVSTKYEEMSKDPSLFPLIRKYILNIVNCVRVNTAVFFPSYSMMHRILETGIEDEMGRRLFLEDQDMDGAELMANVTLFRSTPGQVLFCVCGGRVSEGLDFPGKEMELAVVVGIPYAKPSARQKALLDYYRMRSGESWGPVVKAPAVRKIRQSVGRLIRSEHDRGIAVILDRRAGDLEGLEAVHTVDPVGDVRRFFGFEPGSERSGSDRDHSGCPPAMKSAASPVARTAAG